MAAVRAATERAVARPSGAARSPYSTGRPPVLHGPCRGRVQPVRGRRPRAGCLGPRLVGPTWRAWPLGRQAFRHVGGHTGEPPRCLAHRCGPQAAGLCHTVGRHVAGVATACCATLCGQLVPPAASGLAAQRPRLREAEPWGHGSAPRPGSYAWPWPASGAVAVPGRAGMAGGGLGRSPASPYRVRLPAAAPGPRQYVPAGRHGLPRWYGCLGTGCPYPPRAVGREACPSRPSPPVRRAYAVRGTGRGALGLCHT